MNKIRHDQFPIKANKSLGQHFLSNSNDIEKIIELIESICSVYSCQEIDEIGPGTGVLTLPLLAKKMSMTLLEKDPRAVSYLKSTAFQANIIQTDILRWEPEHRDSPKICIGNLPYYITSDILFWFSEHYKKYHAGIFMVQNEVADRLVAKTSTNDYGRLTIRMQLSFSIEKKLFVPAKSFSPPPKVNSAIVLMTPKDSPFKNHDEEKKFSNFTAHLFNSRRKMLKKTLESYKNADENYWKEFWKNVAEMENNSSLSPQSRPENISPETCLKMFRFLNRS